jgi:hypothetical protein
MHIMSTSAELTNTQALSPAAGGVAEISSMTKGKHPLCQLSGTSGNLLDSLGFPPHTRIHDSEKHEQSYATCLSLLIRGGC